MSSTLNVIAGHWFDRQVAMLWQTAVLIGIIWIVDVLIRKWAHPQVRYALWMLVLVKLLIPPTWTSPASVTSHIPGMAIRAATVMERAESQAPVSPSISGSNSEKPIPRDTQRGQDARVPLPDAGLVDTDIAGTAVEPDTVPPASSRQVNETAKPSLHWKTYAMLTWLAGIIVLSTWLLVRLSGLRREHSVSLSCHPGPRAGIQGETVWMPDSRIGSGTGAVRHDNRGGLPERFYAQLEAVAAKLGLKRLPRVVLTDKVACPAVFGVFCPVLLMPAKKFKHMSARDTEHVLLHELAHIKRGDLLVHAVWMLVQIVYWFNPLLWMIRRTLQNLRELCCDATVARLLRENTVHYRETLLETARQLLAEPVDPGLGLLGLFENNNWLVTRLQWLEKNTWKNRPLRIATIIALVAVMTTCVLPMAQAKSGGKALITKEYRLMRPLKQDEQSMMTTVNHALDRPFADFLRELTGQNRSRNYDMMEYDDFGLLVLTATVNQHSKAEKALQREYGPALRPEKLYSQNDVQTIDTFAENCRKIVKNTFIQLNLMFLTTEDIDYIANDLRDFVKQHTRNDLSKAMQLQILEELDRYIFMNFSSRTLSQQESIYLRFDDRYKSLKFKLWQVIATKPLIEEQKTKLAEQKQWIYDYVSKNYPTTKELEKVRRMYHVDRVFQDVLNGFSQQPMSDETFKELQEKIRNEDNVSGIASTASCWSTDIVKYEYFHRYKRKEKWEFPFGIVKGYSGGSDNVELRFESDKPYLYDNFRLYDVSVEKPENHTYDIASMRPLRAPDDFKTTEQLLAWIDKQNQGDIYYGKKTESIICCRNAKMAVLDVNDWIESDRISTEELRNQIRNNPITSFCVTDYWTLNDAAFDHQDFKPVVPLIAVETKAGAVAVLRPKDLKHRSLDSIYLEVRCRPENWRQQWYSTFITGDTNETVGNRHLSSTTQNHVPPVLRSSNEGGSGTEGSELKTDNYSATLPNGGTVEPKLEFLAWQSEPKNWWEPDGTIVSDKESLELLKEVRAYGCEDESHPNYQWLHLWFSHPDFDKTSPVDLRMVDSSGQHHKFLSTIAHNGIAGNDRNGNRGWALYTVSVGSQEAFPNVCDFELDYATGPWATEIEELPKDYNGIMSFGSGFLLGGIGQNADSKTFINYTHNKTKTSHQQHRFVAVTEKGIILPSGNPQGGYPELYKNECQFDVPLEDVKSFQFQTRKTETVTFKNISLRPGGETEGEIETQSSVSSPQLSEWKELTLPDVDEIPVMLDLASGELVNVPEYKGGAENWVAAIDNLDYGDLFFDDTPPGLTFLRGSDCTGSISHPEGFPFPVYKISNKGDLPETITVTNGLGEQYKLEILSVDNQGCKIRYIALRPGGEVQSSVISEQLSAKEAVEKESTNYELKTKNLEASPQSSGEKTKNEVTLANLSPAELREILVEVRSFTVDESLLKDIGLDISRASGNLVTVSYGSKEMASALKQRKLDQIKISFYDLKVFDKAKEDTLTQIARLIKTTRVDFPNRYEAVTNVSKYCISPDIGYLQTGRPEPIRYRQKADIQKDRKHISFKANYLFMNIIHKNNPDGMSDESSTTPEVEIANVPIHTTLETDKTVLIVGPSFSNTKSSEGKKERLLILIKAKINVALRPGGKVQSSVISEQLSEKKAVEKESTNSELTTENLIPVPSPQSSGEKQVEPEWGETVNDVKLRIGGDDPLGLFYSNNTLWFEIQNNSPEEIRFNQQTFDSKDNQEGWGYLEVLDAEGNPVRYTWNEKEEVRKVMPGQSLKNNSFMNGRPLRKSGPGQYKARLTLVVRRPASSNKTFQIQSNWHSFDVTPCGYPRDNKPGSAYEALRMADADRSMIEYRHATIQETVERYEAIIQKKPDSKYELQSRFGIAQADKAQTGKQCRLIIEKWPDVVTHSTIYARNWGQKPEEWYQWLKSITDEQIIDSARNYFVWPFEPTEEDIQRSAKSMQKAIQLHIKTYENDPSHRPGGEMESRN